MTQAIPIFVIAFKDAKRRAAIRKRLAPLGIKPHFIDAVDGKKLNPGQREIFTGAGREYLNEEPLRDGAMGCSLSHFSIWRKICDEKIPAAIVLEDDATPTQIATDLFDASLALLQRHAADCNVVFLCRFREKRKLIPVNGDGMIRPCLAVQRHADITTLGYFITRVSAEYLLTRRDLLYLHPVDNLLHHWWLHDGDYAPLYLDPPLFTQDGSPSQIGYTEAIRHPDDRLQYKLIRRLRRVRDSFRKRVLFSSHVARIRRRLSSS